MVREFSYGTYGLQTQKTDIIFKNRFCCAAKLRRIHGDVPLSSSLTHV